MSRSKELKKAAMQHQVCRCS